MKKLMKSNKNRILAGVCGGIAEYFDIDPTLVRLAAAALIIFCGCPVLAYIIAAVIMPEPDEVTAEATAEENKEI